MNAERIVTMAKIAWEKAENCPVVNGYVIRVMIERPASRHVPLTKTPSENATPPVSAPSVSRCPPGQQRERADGE